MGVIVHRRAADARIVSDPGGLGGRGIVESLEADPGGAPAVEFGDGEENGYAILVIGGIHPRELDPDLVPLTGQPAELCHHIAGESVAGPSGRT